MPNRFKFLKSNRYSNLKQKLFVYIMYRNKNPIRDELLLDHEFELGPDGDLAVPLDKPGLGVTVKMEAVERFRV